MNFLLFTIHMGEYNMVPMADAFGHPSGSQSIIRSDLDLTTIGCRWFNLILQWIGGGYLTWVLKAT